MLLHKCRISEGRELIPSVCCRFLRLTTHRRCPLPTFTYSALMTYHTHIFVRIIWAPWTWRSCSAGTCRSKIDILNIWFILKNSFRWSYFPSYSSQCLYKTQFSLVENLRGSYRGFLPSLACLGVILKVQFCGVPGPLWAVTPWVGGQNLTAVTFLRLVIIALHKLWHECLLTCKLFSIMQLHRRPRL
jgi:hypothetical protein